MARAAARPRRVKVVVIVRDWWLLFSIHVGVTFGNDARIQGVKVCHPSIILCGYPTHPPPPFHPGPSVSIVSSPLFSVYGISWLWHPLQVLLLYSAPCVWRLLLPLIRLFSHYTRCKIVLRLVAKQPRVNTEWSTKQGFSHRLWLLGNSLLSEVEGGENLCKSIQERIWLHTSLLTCEVYRTTPRHVNSSSIV